MPNTNIQDHTPNPQASEGHEGSRSHYSVDEYNEDGYKVLSLLVKKFTKGNDYQVGTISYNSEVSVVGTYTPTHIECQVYTFRPTV